MFGNLWSQPKTITKQLDEVRQKVIKTQELTERYNKRMDEMTKLNKLLTSGYVNNLNIVVDLSKLLQDYKDTMSEVLVTLRKFDELILKDLDNTDIDHIRLLTDQKMDQINEFFQKDVENIKTVLGSFGPGGVSGDVIARLNTSRQNFGNTYNQGKATYAAMQPRVGGAKSNGKNIKVGSPKPKAKPKSFV